MGHRRRASLLVAFAHPDDEIFHGGTLAHLAERGARVTLVCATDGDAGKAHPSVGPVDDLGALRVEELRRSCTHLGIDEPVLLRFHDSARKERQRHDDPHALATVDMLDVETAMRGIIAEVKPHIVLTSHDRQLLGQTAANMRALRPPDPYKNKGVRYTNEPLRKKVGKTGSGGK